MEIAHEAAGLCGSTASSGASDQNDLRRLIPKVRG